MVKTGQVWSGLIVTKDATGALATPSVGPAGALYVDGIANAASVTVSGANPYKWTVTLPTLTAGQCVSMYITATIAMIATASVVAEDVADIKRVSDLNDAVAAPAAATIAAEILVTPANKLATGAAGVASANVTELKGLTEPLDNLVLSLGNGGLVEKLNSMLEAAGADYRFTAAALAEAPTGAGTGLYSDTITVRVGGVPVDGALVQVATDSAFTNIVRSGYTNSLGQVTFLYDSVGTYYGRAELGGYNVATFTITVSA